MSQWNQKLVYDACFSPEDNLYHRFLDLLQLLILGTAIQHINPVDMMRDTTSNPSTFVFSVCLSILHLLGIVRLVEIQSNVIGGKEAIHHTTALLQRRLFGLVALSLAAIISGYDFFVRGGDTQQQSGSHGEAARKNHFPILLCALSFVLEQIHVLMDVLVWIPSNPLDWKQLRVPLHINYCM